MKVISMNQPFASLVMLGHKKIDTRAQDTDYRGEILIHAGSTKLASARLLSNGVFNRYIPEKNRSSSHGNLTKTKNMDFNHLPFGALIGKAYLCATMPVARLMGHLGGNFTVEGGRYNGQTFTVTEKERSVGDYSYDRTAYFFAGVEVFSEPIPAKGFSWLWEYEM